MGSPLQGNYLLGDTCRRQHDRPRFCVAKPLKGFAPLLFRECRRLSLARENVSAWAGRDTNPIATNRQIVRTPNLNATSFGRLFLWEVVDCHFTLPFVSRVGFFPPTFYLRCWLTSATIRKWQLPIALQGGVLETHHDEHPMKHRS